MFNLLFLLGNNPNDTALMIYRNINSNTNNKPVVFVKIEDISTDFKDKLIKIEDYKFYEHHGFDIGYIQEAYRLNKEQNTATYGGSTITQQLCKTLFLVPSKTYLRKYLELIASIEMELILSKERILELYINYCEWGPGIYGIEQASQYHYNKSHHELTEDEMNKLLSIMPNPLKFNVKNFYKNKIMAYRYQLLRLDFGNKMKRKPF